MTLRNTWYPMTNSAMRFLGLFSHLSPAQIQRLDGAQKELQDKHDLPGLMHAKGQLETRKMNYFQQTVL